jgi:hypothetical protein
MTADEHAAGLDGKCNSLLRDHSGRRCTLPAGWGTDHVGYGPCRKHLGNTENHRKRAADLKLRDQLAALDVETAAFEDPNKVLLQQLVQSGVWEAFVHGRLLEFTDFVSPEAEAVRRVWDDERKFRAQLAKMAIDARVDEKLVRAVEAQGVMLVPVLRAVFDDLRGVLAALGVAPEIVMRVFEAELPGIVQRRLTEQRPAIEVSAA